MASKGPLSAIKSYVPAPVKTKIRDARKKMRDQFRTVKKRLFRPNIYRLHSPERIGAAYFAQSGMRLDEKIFLYAFVRGFQPHRGLEIGVGKGGSALITTNAMEENGFGVHVGVDPRPNLLCRWKDLHGRFKLISKPSPEAIPEAREAAGGPFDFVLIDGLHFYDPVRNDLAAVIPFLDDGAYVLFHDAFHYGVATAVKEALDAHPGLVDCGYPCRTPNTWSDPLTPYNGFRLLRYAAQPVAPRSVDVERVLDPLYAAHKLPRPPYRRDILNHDIWYCRAVSPCDYCRSKQGNGAPEETAQAGA